MRPDILIFCDGGLGNRINSLASGLAVARYFGLTYCVHWPINNWCAAPFEKIFANRLNVSTESISQLRGKLDDAVMLLHDEIASSTLKVKFESAYRFKDLKDFGELSDLKKKSLFYYPALIPNWVPEELVHKELGFLKFKHSIVKEVKEFISNTMPGPFYGLHLRRTDLNVGLSDLEVFNLAKAHPDAVFFVCSDDSQAESLAAAHPNVFRREKKFQIEKKTGDSDWLAQTQDDDGRFYHGNIQRNEEAVVEGAIDMLILAHSQIVGFSGSTFQRMSKTLGETCPIILIKKPNPINYIGIKEIKRQLMLKTISPIEILNYTKLLESSGNLNQAIRVLELALNFFDGIEAEDILYRFSEKLVKKNKFLHSIIYIKQIIINNPNNISAWIFLSYIYFKLNDVDNVVKVLNEVKRLPLNDLTKQDVDLLYIVQSSLNKIEIL